MAARDKILQGDALEVMRTLPDGCVDMCVTSPPYWGLRDYGTGQWEGEDGECDHLKPRGKYDQTKRVDGGIPANNANALEPYRATCAKCGAKRVDGQLGLEPTLAEYVGKMVAMFAELRRVLADHGTLWLNLGDSYATQGGRGEARMAELGHPSDGAITNPQAREQASGTKLPPGLKPKDLCGIPWRVALALQADGWWLRSDIVWAKPNPMPGSYTDRPTSSHEYLFLLSKRAQYYYDAEAVREEGPTYTRKAGGYHGRDGNNASRFGGKGGFGDSDVTTTGRNRRDVWNIATQAFPDAHFATFPEALVQPCILAGTSERGYCVECGKPWVRVVEPSAEYDKVLRLRQGPMHTYAKGKVGTGYGSGKSNPSTTSEYQTTGWRASCTCGAATRPGVVFDPFGGSGTVAVISHKEGRHYLLIELSPDYIAMAERRIAKEAPDLQGTLGL